MKRILMVVLAMMMISGVCFAANSQTSYRTSTDGVHVNRNEASVDTDPGTDGLGCLPISIKATRGEKAVEMWFYVKTVGTDATITLQWSDDGGTTYYDYPTTRYDIEAGGKDIIRDSSAGVYWRLIVKDNEQGSSGASVFGICW